MCELVMDRINDSELERLKETTQVLTELSGDGITSGFITTECALHSYLYGASKNNKLAKLLSEQQHVFARMWHSFERSQGDIQSQVDDWTHICAAIEENDTERLKAVYKNHFKSFYESLKRFF